MEAIKNALQSAIARKDSVIVTDPTGSLYDETATMFREAGYTVKVINV